MAVMSFVTTILSLVENGRMSGGWRGTMDRQAGSLPGFLRGLDRLMREKLLALAGRVERMAAPDPGIDRLVDRLVGPHHDEPRYDAADDPFDLATPAPAYTDIFEAALTLLPDDCRLAMLADRPDGEGWYCALDRPTGPAGSYVARSLGAATPARAVAAAALRLHAAFVDPCLSVAA